jgi:hypothetical protein
VKQFSIWKLAQKLLTNMSSQYTPRWEHGKIHLVLLGGFLNNFWGVTGFFFWRVFFGSTIGIFAEAAGEMFRVNK